MTQREEAENLAKIVVPYTVENLYKYRSMQSRGLEDIFSKRHIYLTDATKFNDPFESKPILTYHRNSIKRERFLKELTKEKFPTADKRILKKLMKGKKAKLTDPDILKNSYNGFVSTIGIYCLSEKNDDLLMWSNYSDSHKGLCLEFETSTKWTFFWEALKVTYQEDYPVVNIMDIGKAYEFRKALLTKSTHWRHEEERRILKNEQDGGPDIYSFQLELLTGVILGALMSEKDKDVLINWIKAYPTNVNIYKAKLNERKYQIDIVPFSEP